MSTPSVASDLETTRTSFAYELHPRLESTGCKSLLKTIHCLLIYIHGDINSEIKIKLHDTIVGDATQFEQRRTPSMMYARNPGRSTYPLLVSYTSRSKETGRYPSILLVARSSSRRGVFDAFERLSITLSIEHAYQCPCVMTPSGSEARRMGS